MKLYEQTREVMERYQAKPAVMAAQAETMKAVSCGWSVVLSQKLTVTSKNRSGD